MPPFVDRHIGPRTDDRAAMLEAIGHPDLDEFVDAVVPADIRQDAPLDLPAALSEEEALGALRDFASRNTRLVQMIGQGYWDTHTPAVIRRNVLENPAWYTAYTPYQPEISQGRLEALLNFQTMVEDLTGLDIANASLLDEASAAAEAVLLMRRATKRGSRLLVDADTFPQVLAVLQSRCRAVDIAMEVVDLTESEIGDDVFGVYVQQPAASGRIRDLAPVVEAAHAVGAKATVATDLLALTLLTTPGDVGADIAIGSAQRFGVPLFFGGPHAAFMSIRKGMERQLPGRLVGVSKDADGRPAYRLAIQTREQHIRREKATSNICTAQALLAVVASMYAVYHGPEGLTAIAEHAHASALRIAALLRAAGLTVVHERFFDTVRIEAPGRADELVAAALGAGVNIARIDDDTVQFSTDETTTSETVTALVAALGGDPDILLKYADPLTDELRRTSAFLTHPTFHTHRSETQLMRYLRRLADRDLALDRTMIPLGSCTMKLNAAAEMEAISWPEFAGIHPYAPADQSAGWRALIQDLEDRLVAITGYDTVSLQPNAGSQGELAGLLAIRRFHRANGDLDRRVVLIPASAHGTNAASAVLAGLSVKVVGTAADGSIDMDDLRAQIESIGAALAGIMITYPSTHGVFETDVREVCRLVHDAGGQVYADGANLNALVGLAKPGEFGGDVSHLNLHKTFCIPHGGGGPGVGPVAAKAHLAPFLPGDPHADGGNAVASSEFGSAGVLPISWAYIAMMGPDGLRDATVAALIGANYVATELDEAFPTLYTGATGLVGHECILDLRDLTKASGVTAEDVAKRLVDYGFHAPTLAFPVPGTLMVEPTESEDLAELDRFIAAMRSIRAEIDAVARGDVAIEDSVVRNAPHTAASIADDGWDRFYSRREAVFPVASLHQQKYFPPVSRIDGAYGDRNLVCSCPPPDAFEEFDALETEGATR